MEFASELGPRVQAWIDDDPDPVTAEQLRDLLDLAGDRNKDETMRLAARQELADMFAAFLEFGTAGLRGALGGGPNRMNRAVVIRTAPGLITSLTDTLGAQSRPRVVIGYAARHQSDAFARDTAAVITAAGGEALLFPRLLPTPVLAFAVRHLDADAGVMVTASHNPPQDNGY
jgi:phosphomannomutase